MNEKVKLAIRKYGKPVAIAIGGVVVGGTATYLIMTQRTKSFKTIKLIMAETFETLSKSGYRISNPDAFYIQVSQEVIQKFINDSSTFTLEKTGIPIIKFPLSVAKVVIDN